MKPKISVIIPALNEELRIGDCLESLKGQAFPKEQFEVILVNANSTDDTTNIAKKYGVKIISLDNSPSIGSTRHIGVKAAQGEILAFTDADIKVETEWLSKIHKEMSDPSLICIGGQIMPDSEDIVLNFIYSIYNFFIILNQHLFGLVLLWGSNMAVRKKSYIEVEGFNPDLEMSEDWDLGKRLQKKFTRPSVKYKSYIKAKTSIRKQKNPFIFLNYLTSGFSNYINFAFLGNLKTGKPKHIR